MLRVGSCAAQRGPVDLRPSRRPGRGRFCRCAPAAVARRRPRTRATC